MRMFELKYSDIRWLKGKRGDINDYDPDYGISQQVHQLFDYMTNNGYTLLGQGHFSRVYGSSDSSVVVKISQKPDRSWVNFINFYYNNRKNPHLPKVARKMIELDSEGNMFVAFCEHLEDLDNAPTNIQKALAWFMMCGDQSSVKNDYSGLCGDPNLWYIYLHNEKDLMSPKLKQNTMKWLKSNPEFLPTMKAVVDRGNSMGYEMDMKPDNFRYRSSNKKVVIVDPFYDVNDCG